MDPIRVPPDMFRFTGAEHAGLYVSVLQAFGEANERLETALGIDDVRVRLRAVGWLDMVEDDDLAKALEQLRAWKLVDVIQNHSENYRTASEYERRNLQYSLTRRGEAAFAGVLHAMSVLVSTGALQTAVLDAISDRLGDLARELDGTSDRRVFTTLTELEGHLEALRTNTTQFNGELQRLLRVDGTDLATFQEVKASTVAYLQEFLTDLDQRAHTIATRIGVIEARGVAMLHQRALLGAELPTLSGTDPGPAWLEHRRARWEGLRAWFLPMDGTAPAGRPTAPGRPPGHHHVAAGARPDRRVSPPGQQRGGRLPRAGTVVHGGAGAGRPAPSVVDDVRAQLSPPCTPGPSRSRAGQRVDVVAGGTRRPGLGVAEIRRPDRTLQPHGPGP